MSTVPQFIKPPYDIRDYSCDYTPELDRIGETIEQSTWTMASGTIDGPANQAITLDETVTPSFGASPTPVYAQGGTLVSDNEKVATCFIAGGTSGRTYTIQNEIITTGSPPRRYSQQFVITIRG